MAIGRSGPAAGLYFKREWCGIADEVRADLDLVRYWDLAATEKTEFNDPDWTVGIKLGRDTNGGYWVLDMVRGRANPGDVDRLLLNTATHDGNRVHIGFGKDPGQAGKTQAFHLVRALSGFTATPATESGGQADKVWAVQLAAPHRQREYLATPLERGVVSYSRRIS